MTIRQDPITGNLTGASGSMGGANHVTPQMREQAFFCGDLADNLLPILDSGKSWFTAYEIRQMPAFLAVLVDVGVITKHQSTKHNGHYYKPTAATRPFLLTALALRDERIKSQQERAEGSAGR